MLAPLQTMSQTTFNGRVYHQVHSTAVGSPVSIVVTNVVRRTSIRKHWQRFIPPTHTHFCRRLVNGTCCTPEGPCRLLSQPAKQHQHQCSVYHERVRQTTSLTGHSPDERGGLCQYVYSSSVPLDHPHMYMSLQSKRPVTHKRAAINSSLY